VELSEGGKSETFQTWLRSSVSARKTKGKKKGTTPMNSEKGEKDNQVVTKRRLDLTRALGF